MEKISELQLRVLNRLDEYYDHEIINNCISSIAQDLKETDVRVKRAVRALKRKGLAILTVLMNDDCQVGGSNYIITEKGHQLLKDINY